MNTKPKILYSYQIRIGLIRWSSEPSANLDVVRRRVSAQLDLLVRMQEITERDQLRIMAECNQVISDVIERERHNATARRQKRMSTPPVYRSSPSCPSPYNKP